MGIKRLSMTLVSGICIPGTINTMHVGDCTLDKVAAIEDKIAI
jgi:hypothetical protein